MNLLFYPLVHHPLKTLVKALCVALIVTGCGGGGTSGSATKTSFASGPITGLGSIYVNGVRYDDSSAKVSSEDDDSGTSRDRSELKLGMVVEIEASGSSSDGSSRSGTASEVRFGSEIVGPFDKTSVNLTAMTFELLGQTVKVTGETMFEDLNVAAWKDLPNGFVLEVHGIRQTDGSYLATRIEAESATHFKLRGAISELNVVPDTFKIGTALISYASIKPLTMTLQDGDIVRVKLATAPATIDGPWVATKIKSGDRKMSDHDEAEVKGVLAIIPATTSAPTTSAPTTYTVDGRAFVLDVGIALPAGAGNGAYVEVEGRVVGGQFIASKIEIEDESSPDFGEFVFKDKIAALVETTNGDATEFTVKGMKILVDASTMFTSPATSAGIKNDDCVEVKAAPIVGGTDLLAKLIKLDNSCR